jgi:hypothetical protein
VYKECPGGAKNRASPLDMKHFQRLLSTVIIILLLILTTYTSILLFLSNNKSLFADVRVLVHGRNNTIKGLSSFQNMQGYANTLTRARTEQKNYSSSFLWGNMSALSAMIPGLESYSYANNNAVLEDGIRIAIIEPTFTAAAYNNSFYLFYQKYSDTPAKVNITKDLNLLSNTVTSNPTITPTPKVHSAFAMLSLLKNLKLISPQSNITVLTDVDVNNGLIFKRLNSGRVDPNTNAYDLIILGHQEYVTQKEYDHLKKFVSNGGTMMLLDGNVFYAQVRFDRITDTITLVKGHGWAYNGKSAWKSVNERWTKETSEWVGSNYLCYSCNISFANDPWEYQHHEEQYVTNANDKILMNYNASLLHNSLRPIIATYELNYQKGRVISLGIYSDDVINNQKFERYFDNLILQYSSQQKL